MFTFQNDLAFLKQSNYTTAIGHDPKRVRKLLVHSSVDMRLAAVKSMLVNQGANVVRELITLFCTDPSWRHGGLTPASRWIVPRINDTHGELLVECFPELAIRNVHCFKLFCSHCDSPILRDRLQNVLFDDSTPCAHCYLAIKCLSVYGVDQTAIWDRCFDHRCREVARLAKILLRVHIEDTG